MQMDGVVQTGSQTPYPTVYVRNLNERVKIPVLTETLRSFFSEFGNVVDVVARKNLRAKGQAFIVYDDPAAAAQAIEEANGFDIFDRPMKLEWARSPSDVTVRAQGTDDDFEAHKRRRLAEKERKQAILAHEALQRAARPADPTAASKTGKKATTTAAAASVADEFLPPNKILFVRNLPDDYGVDELSVIFSRFEGFREVRLVPGRKGIAFVEYENETGAISAKESTNKMAVGDEGKEMMVTYQRQ